MMDAYALIGAASTAFVRNRGQRPPPLKVALHLVVDVPTHFGDTFRERKGQAGAMGPLAGIDSVGTAYSVANHGLELDGGPQGIADGEAQQAATLSVIKGGHVLIPPRLGLGELGDC